MIRSMTAFGRGEHTDEHGTVLVELQSVNRKHLEIDVNLPRELSALEPQVRRRLAAAGRGKVNCTVSARLAAGETQAVEPNEPLARMVKESYQQLRDALGYDGPVAFETIARNKEVLTFRNGTADAERFWPAVEAPLDEALTRLLEMKTTEGEAIRRDFEGRLGEIVAHVDAIEQAAPAAVERFRQRVTERLRELAIELVDNGDRLVREAAILADKLDISEELMRLRSHVEQFHSYLRADDPAVGRTLEFLTQEMHRELNTMGNKSQELDITNRVVLAKSALEKIREQVRNVE
ncbi:MAG: YicC family protein [Verrucomicrobia bacterium]|nr:YicC family protein [Verrucomicrobiota bacterium]